MFNLFNRQRDKQRQTLIGNQQFGAPLITAVAPHSIQAEQFRNLRTNLEFMQVERDLKSVMVTSSIAAEGKSTIAANLGKVLADREKKVLIVDADLRRPNLHRTFGISNEKGLTSILLSRDTKVFSDVIQYHQASGLYLLSAGPIPPNPSELIAGMRMDRIVHELSKLFDYVIYDTSPLGAVADGKILATKVDGAILVIRDHYVDKQEVLTSIEALQSVHAPLLGYVINGRQSDQPAEYYTYRFDD